MYSKLFALFLVLTMFIISVPTAFAGKQTGDWNSLQSLKNTEVAVKAKGKETVFGVLRGVENDALRMQIISDNNNYEIVFPKDDVEKVWQAELRSGRNTGKGALIGAGIGAGIGVAVYTSVVRGGEADGLDSLDIPFYGIVAGVVGAIGGFFSKKGHKKKKLIYSVS